MNDSNKQVTAQEKFQQRLINLKEALKYFKEIKILYQILKKEI